MLNKYIIKNGTLLSIEDGVEKKADILVENGIITKIEAEINAADADILDASGMYVSTGWLDAHCHFANQADDSIGINPENDLLCQGVTYALDLGTLGPANYTDYRRTLLWRTDLKFKSYMNIAKKGVGNASNGADFESPEDIDCELVKEQATKYRGELLGLKARIDDKFCFDPEYVMTRLRQLGDELDMPIAVHAPRSRIGIEKLLSFMKKGDVLCHTLAGNSDVMDILDEDGHIKPCVLEAQKRGVVFDLSHGTNAFSYDTAETAWKAGFFTDTISSDLHKRNLQGPVFNLGVVLTKVRGITGQDWWWILNKTIKEPVRLLGINDKDTEIAVGNVADLTLFKLETGDFTYLDSKKESRTFKEKITATYTLVGNKIYTCR